MLPIILIVACLATLTSSKQIMYGSSQNEMSNQDENLIIQNILARVNKALQENMKSNNTAMDEDLKLFVNSSLRLIKEVNSETEKDGGKENNVEFFNAKVKRLIELLPTVSRSLHGQFINLQEMLENFDSVLPKNSPEPVDVE